MLRAALLFTVAAVAHAHMGISSPAPVDQAVGDAYRYPVSAGNSPENGGACHGQGATAKYAWVWTPTFSGQCEIYMNCYESLPASPLVMSGGAPHGGGKCKLYECDGPITIPNCVRMQLDDTFGNCKAIATYDDCTEKGEFVFTSDGAAPAPAPGPAPAPSPAPAPVPAPAPFPEKATRTKIRCGTTWVDANNKCGDQCLSDGDCSGGERCYADLQECPEGETEPVPKPTPAPAPAGSGECVSTAKHIPDLWCKQTACDKVYVDAGFCGFGKSEAFEALTVQCQLFAVEKEGDPLEDYAIRYDTTAETLRLQNPDMVEPLRKGAVYEAGADCTAAKAEVTINDYANDARADAPWLVAVAALLLATQAVQL